MTYQNDIEIGQLEVDEETGALTMILHADANTMALKSSKYNAAKQDIVMNVEPEEVKSSTGENSSKLVAENSLGIISQSLKSSKP